MPFPTVLSTSSLETTMYHFVNGSSQQKPYIMYVSMEISHDDLLQDTKKLIEQVFPDWKHEQLEIQQFQEGITNKLLRCQCKGAEDIILVKVYGKKTEILIDRERELRNIVSLNLHGFCPPVYAQFRNGFVYGYVHGRPLTPDELSKDEQAYLISKRLGEWHRLVMNQESAPDLFLILRKWLHLSKFHEDDEGKESFFL
jgi:ethanolamine kinase